MLSYARFLLVSLSMIIGGIGHAQTQDTIPTAPRYWELNGAGNIQFNQLSLTNWAAGGESNINLTSRFVLTLDYKKPNDKWNNKLQVDYGLIRPEELPWRKNLDIFTLTSAYSHIISQRWYLNAFMNLLTQVTPGYNYRLDPLAQNYISNFFAPAFLQEGIGLEYRRDSVMLTLMIAPISAKHTFVYDRGVDETNFGLLPGRRARHELGASFRLNFKRELRPGFLTTSTLTLFSNYLERPQNIDVIWQTSIDYLITKYLSVSLNTNLIYDDDIMIPRTQVINGVEQQIGEGPAIQFKQAFGIGLTYTM